MNALKGLGFAASVLGFALAVYAIMAAPGLISDMASVVPANMILVGR